MKIAIIGAGNIGGTLGRKWQAAGHNVIFGVRDPDKADDLPAPAQLPSEAVVGADVVLFAVPGQAMGELVPKLAAHLNGQVLLDATNKPGQATLNSLDLLREAAPDSSLYRAFSTLGWENFAEPLIDGHMIDLFYCGDSAKKDAVSLLIEQIGLRPVYLGGVDQVEIVDHLTRLWFNLAFQQGYGRRVALSLLTG